MKKFSIASIIIILLGFFFCTALYAQSRRSIQYREHPSSFGRNQRYYAIGGFIAGLNYFGDLAPTNEIGSTYIPLTRAGLGITGSYRFKRYLSVRSNFMWGRLRGDDITADMEDEDGRFRYARNLHFRNDIKELSFEFVVDFFNHHRTFATRRKLSPYLFFGVAVFHHNPRAKVPEMDALHYDIFESQPIQENDPRYNGVSPGDWIALKPLGTEGQHLPGSDIKPYSNWQFAVPGGIGARFRVNRLYDINLELGMRQTFTDYLDDVSTEYINPGAFGEGPKANLVRLMSNRSKEPVTAVTGEKRNLEYVLENVYPAVSFGELPDEFGPGPYELINTYGMEGPDYIRGKDAYDIFIVTKITVIYYIGSGFGYNRVIGP
ncbi:DUF6089 family protein [Nafulsella turpanensis]|uniref:DUF6089 family protein n=1 Tax=Nafulsella turpanensis TaxID=1265690 RepID=UPI0003652847|nr:DUF6089 family protein [Nafulsella turpanensis]